MPSFFHPPRACGTSLVPSPTTTTTCTGFSAQCRHPGRPLRPHRLFITSRRRPHAHPLPDRGAGSSPPAPPAHEHERRRQPASQPAPAWRAGGGCVPHLRGPCTPRLCTWLAGGACVDYVLLLLLLNVCMVWGTLVCFAPLSELLGHHVHRTVRVRRVSAHCCVAQIPSDTLEDHTRVCGTVDDLLRPDMSTDARLLRYDTKSHGFSLLPLCTRNCARWSVCTSHVLLKRQCSLCRVQTAPAAVFADICVCSCTHQQQYTL